MVNHVDLDEPFVRDLTLADFPFLASLAASESAHDRRIWLRVAIDHFVAVEPKDPDAQERFSDVVALQLDSAGAATRLEIARRLAPCARTPARLLKKFESADSEAGDYMLERAVAYTDHDLEQAVARGGRHAVAVAKRKNVSPQIVCALAARDEVDVLVALASNGSARLEGGMLVDLLLRARTLAEQAGDRRLADSLLQRRPLAPEGAALFLCAKPGQRVDILLAAQRLQLGRPRAFAPPIQQEWLDELELAAVARKPERFVAILAEALDCDPELARRIVDDASGEPLAVALAALGASNEVLVRVLISNDLSAGASYQRIRALARLNNALNRNAAIAVMAALRGETAALRRSQSLVDTTAPAQPRAAKARMATKPFEPPQRKAVS